ncbi:hypothetical protein [Streptomyces sp. NPDC005805]|uniref:hypothetical protein n=1 Tax=Streptomyces sp. NPDC005805 TaxID=3157068 RepID=UPI0033EBCC13
MSPRGQGRYEPPESWDEQTSPTYLDESWTTGDGRQDTPVLGEFGPPPVPFGTGYAGGPDEDPTMRVDPRAAALTPPGGEPDLPPTLVAPPGEPLVPAGGGGHPAEPVHRFGPGVPPYAGHPASGESADRGSRRRRREPRERRSPLLRFWVALLVLALTAGFLVWRYHFAAPLDVRGTSVSGPVGRLGCGATAEIAVTVRTNGAEGILRYRWVRSDGTGSGTMREALPRGTDTARLRTSWSFNGPGEQDAWVTLQFVDPVAEPATASFLYSCADAAAQSSAAADAHRPSGQSSDS